MRRSALEVSVTLPSGWECHDRVENGAGGGTLLIIPHITPRSRSTSGLGKNTKFEMRVLSSVDLGGNAEEGARLALTPATMALGGGTMSAAKGPFAEKPALRVGPRSRSTGR